MTVVLLTVVLLITSSSWAPLHGRAVRVERDRDGAPRARLGDARGGARIDVLAPRGAAEQVFAERHRVPEVVLLHDPVRTKTREKNDAAVVGIDAQQQAPRRGASQGRAARAAHHGAMRQQPLSPYWT